METTEPRLSTGSIGSSEIFEDISISSSPKYNSNKNRNRIPSNANSVHSDDQYQKKDSIFKKLFCCSLKSKNTTTNNLSNSLNVKLTDNDNNQTHNKIHEENSNNEIIT